MDKTTSELATMVLRGIELLAVKLDVEEDADLLTRLHIGYDAVQEVADCVEGEQ